MGARVLQDPNFVSRQVSIYSSHESDAPRFERLELNRDDMCYEDIPLRPTLDSNL